MEQPRQLAASIAPNEIVFTGTPIEIESRESLDPESAQSGITMRGVRGSVRLSKNGRVARWRAECDLPPGHHTLLVRGLMTRTGRGIDQDLHIPFFVTDSVAKPPAAVRVDSMVRLRVHEMHTERVPSHCRPAGKFIEILKASHRRTGAPMALAFDEAGRKVQGERVLRQMLEKRARRFGKLHETLHAALESLGATRRVPVAIWLACKEALAADEKSSRKPALRPGSRVKARRKAIAARVKEFAAVLEREHGCAWRADAVAPVVYADLTRAQIQAIAEQPQVIALFLHEIEGIEDLGDSLAIANSDDVHTLGFRGSGVKVAVWENSPDVTTNLSITARYKTSGFLTSNHARHTHGIVKNVERRRPHGHAPSCSLHSANSMDLDAVRWAAKDKGCTVISQSFHRPSEPGSSGLSYDDIYKDWLVLQWPYPTICQAAGNFWQGDSDNIQPPSSEYVNHKGYNSLAVGNHDDSAGAMSGDSVFRNPSSTHGDRELPEIAANGTSVTTVGLTMSGTSMASPAAAGCAALLQNASAILKSWPEGCRAILLAAAKRNVAGNTWWQDVVAGVDAGDGTGAVDALEGLNIAKQRRSRNAAATQRGWDVGTLRSGDIGRDRRATFSYFVNLPRTFLGPRHVKVALAWDSHVITFPFFGSELLLGSFLTEDLDLQIFDRNGNQVGYSGSWDNSYEIAEFRGRPGETYEIKIRRWSGTSDVWYGIAWTVTGGITWADVTRYTPLQQLVEDRLHARHVRNGSRS